MVTPPCRHSGLDALHRGERVRIRVRVRVRVMGGLDALHRGEWTFKPCVGRIAIQPRRTRCRGTNDIGIDHIEAQGLALEPGLSLALALSITLTLTLII